MKHAALFFLVGISLLQIHAKHILKDDADFKFLDRMLEELQRKEELKIKTPSEEDNDKEIKHDGVERKIAIDPETQAIYDELAKFGPIDYTCGYRHYENGSNVDVHEVVPGLWPWHVQIRVCSPSDMNDCYLCSGILIGPMWVISSARCFHGKDYTTESVQVWLGQKSFSDEPDEGAIVKTPLNIYLREEYDDSTFDNNLALIYLPGVVLFDSVIDRVCVNWDASKPFDSTSSCFVTGWGSALNGGSYYPSLQHSESPPIITADCRALTDWDDDTITDSMVCSGHINGENDACPQDYGSPLVCGDYAGRFTLIGIYSFGANGDDCYTPGYPQVYSKVSPFIPWVREIILEETGMDVYNLIG